jgi:SAM-dependent methyltransferase
MRAGQELPERMSDYYADKIDLLRDIFGADSVVVLPDGIEIDGRRYPIVDDVIVLLDPAQLPATLARHLAATASESDGDGGDFAADIQSTFGREWQTFPEILPEHEAEFRQYFDLVDLEGLKGRRVADLGCGIGRWSHFLKAHADELVLVDFSEAIFVARRNLADADNAVFLMADLLQMPLRAGFADFAFCLGVAHHLPIDALEAVRRLSRYAPRVLVYLYSALDGHPIHYRLLMRPVDALRRAVCRVESEAFRTGFSWLATGLLYLPMIGIGHLLRPLSLSRYVPLFDFYQGKSLNRIRQDAYDRFFTRIEQRFSRRDIAELGDTFSSIEISSGIPMWHFVCER